MSNTLSEKIGNTRHAIADATRNVGRKIAEGAEKAVDFVKDKIGTGEGKNVGIAGIKENMDVCAS